MSKGERIFRVLLERKAERKVALLKQRGEKSFPGWGGETQTNWKSDAKRLRDAHLSQRGKKIPTARKKKKKVLESRHRD